MKKKIFIVMALALFIAMIAGPVNAGERFIAQTELIQYNPDKAFNGYTLFNPFSSSSAYLIDMLGNVVHRWDCDSGPGLYGYLMENGNLMRGSQRSDAGSYDTYGVLRGPACGGLQEIAWDGTVVWETTHMSADSISHHDFRRIWNNKLGAYTNIFLAFERQTPEDAISKGCDPKYEAGYTNNGNGWSLDGIYEVDMAGNTVWMWTFADHLTQSYDPAKANYVADVSTVPEKLDINCEVFNGGPHTDWTHCNSLDYNQELDQIVVNAKNMSEFYVIDHGGTFVAGDPAASIAAAASDKGDFLYRFGSPSVYGQGDPPGYMTEGHQQMYGSHDIQWIGGANAAWDASELPGGGNFLIFDNGCWCPTGMHSEVLEINPYKKADGTNSASYVNPPDAGYTRATGGMMGAASLLNNQVEWRYLSGFQHNFYAVHISGATRLPNGNTLIMSGTTGHMFEVTAQKEVVWEYQNPLEGGFGGGVPTPAMFQTDENMGSFSVFRCHRYAPDFAGLAGRDLTPKGTITGRVPTTVYDGLNRPPAAKVYTGWGADALTSEGGGGDAGGAAGGGGGGGY